MGFQVSKQLPELEYKFYHCELFRRTLPYHEKMHTLWRPVFDGLRLAYSATGADTTDR